MTNNPNEPTSPACLAHEDDDAYMGFASRAEIAAFLNEPGSGASGDYGRAAQRRGRRETASIAIFCAMFTTTRRDGVPCS